MERMSRRPGRKGTRAAAEAELRPGERLSVLFPALTPPPDSGGGTTMAALAPLILAAEHIAWRRHSRATSGASKFPLAPRMFIGLTDSRILVWSARWRWRIGKFLGDITLDQVMAAKPPTVGAGWRTVLIHLAHGAEVHIKVPGTTADRVADRLSSPLSGRASEDSPSQ